MNRFAGLWGTELFNRWAFSLLRPSCVDPVQYELRLVDRRLDRRELRRARPVRVERRELSRAQERRGEEDRVFRSSVVELSRVEICG